MPDREAIIDQFRTFLAAKGKRLTRSRETVVEVLLSFGPRIDLDTRIAWLGLVCNVSRSTIYRMLHEMELAGLARWLPSGEYEL